MEIDFKSYRTWEIIGSVVAAIVLLFLIFPPSCSGGYSDEPRDDSNSSKTSSNVGLENYKIILLPYDDDYSGPEYIVKQNVLLKLNGSNTEVCGPLKRISNSVFQVDVGSDYEDGGKIWPYNAGLFKRNNEKIGGITNYDPREWRFCIFDFNEMRVYRESDYEYRTVADQEYFRIKLVER